RSPSRYPETGHQHAPPHGSERKSEPDINIEDRAERPVYHNLPPEEASCPAVYCQPGREQIGKIEKLIVPEFGEGRKTACLPARPARLAHRGGPAPGQPRRRPVARSPDASRPVNG